MASLNPREHRGFHVSPGEDPRWHEIWQLVVSAERQPFAAQRDFILSAQADSFIIRQAIAILDGSASMGTDASSPPSMPASDSQHFTPQVGMKIGRYRIGTLLGSGASGSVYAGFDEELNRTVAIKFFAPHHQAKADTPTLPMREARAASALIHPNIVVIHEVIETGDVAAIVMEFVPGTTLRALAGKTQPLVDVLGWSEQLANALAVAHANHLIHGDIKPENVVVRDDGYLKLLDFGLALDTVPDSRNSAYLTGTPRYLSPEQCLGQRLTPASDIFAFGVMLYEFTTGQHPFSGEGMLALLQEITSADPRPPISINSKLPRAFNQLIMEMLAKEPEQRPTAQKTADRLATIARQSGSRHSIFGINYSWWALAVLIIVAAWLLLSKREPRGGIDLTKLTIRPVASQLGLESEPSISPDGKWITCLFRRHPNDRPQFQIHGTQGEPSTLIDTGQVVVEQNAAWSPDSNDLAFIGLDHSGKRFVYRVSRAGGSVSKIGHCLSLTGCGLDWSPDGRSLVMSDRLPGKSVSELFLLDLATGNRRSLIEGGFSIEFPRFSPDGKWIAFSRPTTFTSSELCLIPSSGGTVRRLAPRPWWFRGLDWNRDSQSIVAISARQSDHPEIWQFPIKIGSEPVRVAAFDMGRSRDVRISRGRGSFVWVRDLSSASISRMSVNQPGRPAEQLISSAGTESDAEWSSQGRMVFYSNRSGTSEIWLARADGSGQTQATRFRGPFVGDPHWSPDGRRVAFTAHPEGNADIFTITCDSEGPRPCADPKQLTQSRSTDANPTWSGDGRWIYFSSNRSGSFEIWKIGAGGGEPERVTWKGGYVAHESADGRWLYYSKIDNQHGFFRMPLPVTHLSEQEEIVRSVNPFNAAATWALGAHELYYYPSEAGGSTALPSVRAIDLDSRKVRDLPTGNAILGRGLSLSPDGNWLLRTQKDRALSLVMIAE